MVGKKHLDFLKKYHASKNVKKAFNIRLK